MSYLPNTHTHTNIHLHPHILILRSGVVLSVPLLVSVLLLSGETGLCVEQKKSHFLGDAEYVCKSHDPEVDLAVVGVCVIIGDACRYLHCRSMTQCQRGPGWRNLTRTADLREASGHGLNNHDIIVVVWAVVVQRTQLCLCLLHEG